MWPGYLLEPGAYSSVAAVLGINVVVVVLSARPRTGLDLLGMAVPALQHHGGNDERRHNLPAQLTSFVGREMECAALRRLVAEQRLLTLTGAGGLGKTRLALQVAAATLVDFSDGVWLVDFAPLLDPTLVWRAVADTLGLREQTAQSIPELVVSHLRRQVVLLVLDNCEHLLDACAELADTVLGSCARVHILATSREPLRTRGEATWAVPPLGLPDGQSPVADCEAVRLFLERAEARVPGFASGGRVPEIVGEICQRLDGMPLAIELAAARLRGLSVEQIADRLDNRFRLLTGGSRTAHPRQQTLQATVEWSYELLPPAERLLFDRLSVFAGGWHLDAAEVVGSGEGLDPSDVLGLLLELVEKSLVIAEHDGHGAVRYRMLETLRQYGNEQLAARHELTAMRDAHAAFYLGLAEAAEPALLGSDIKRWRPVLTRERQNLRAALGWLIERADEDRALRMGGALYRDWEQHSDYGEGRSWLSRLLTLFGGAPPTPALGKVLHGAALLAWHQGDYRASEAAVAEGIVVWERLADRGQRALSLRMLSYLALVRRDYRVARDYGAEAIAEARAAGRPVVAALCMLTRARAALEACDYATARSELTQARTDFDALGFPDGTKTADEFIATIDIATSNYAAARAPLMDGLRWWTAQGGKVNAANSERRLGWLAIRTGELSTARPHLWSSLAGATALGATLAVVLGLEAVAALASAQRCWTTALQLAGAAAAARERMGAPISPADHDLLEPSLAAARAALGARAAAEAWDAGRELGGEQALDLARRLVEPTSVRPPAWPQGAEDRAGLTTREYEVAARVARGLTNRQIAAELVIAHGTATLHVKHILAKLGFTSRSQIAAWFAQLEQLDRAPV